MENFRASRLGLLLLARRLKGTGGARVAAAAPQGRKKDKAFYKLNRNEHTELWEPFLKWKRLVEEALVRDKDTPGPIYFGADKPFPHNPEFVHSPPLTERCRDLIHRRHLQDPDYWTPRKLALNYRVSPARVRAILLLKHHELLLLAKGFQPDVAFVGRMETLTAARDNLREGIWHPMVKDRKPTFVTLSEGVTLTRAQAAELLQKPLPSGSRRPVWAGPADRLTSPCSVEEVPRPGPVRLLLPRDPMAGGKHAILVVDTTSGPAPQQRHIVVRERDGSLRAASPAERVAEGRRIWAKDFARHVLPAMEPESGPVHPDTISRPSGPIACLPPYLRAGPLAARPAGAIVPIFPK